MIRFLTDYQTSMENYEEALQDCKKAISFDPDYSKAYSRMGLIYSKINLFAESENCYEKALKLEPDNESYKKNIQVFKCRNRCKKFQEPDLNPSFENLIFRSSKIN